MSGLILVAHNPMAASRFQPDLTVPAVLEVEVKRRPNHEQLVHEARRYITEYVMRQGSRTDQIFLLPTDMYEAMMIESTSCPPVFRDHKIYWAADLKEPRGLMLSSYLNILDNPSLKEN
jgi:hypothetical protein